MLHNLSEKILNPNAAAADSDIGLEVIIVVSRCVCWENI